MSIPPSDRVRVRRLPKRGHYDAPTVHAILDAGFVCHLGFVDHDQPYVIPTLYGRDGDTLLLHGSAASRALRLAATLPVCVTVTHIDGLVLARSLFNHSANYRSVVAVGDAIPVTDDDEKTAALRVIAEHLVPGRWDEARAPNTKELRATSILRLPLTEASAKVRTGPPGDDAEDMRLDVWAGVVPLDLVAGAPQHDPALAGGIDVPPSVAGWVPGADRVR